MEYTHYNVTYGKLRKTMESSFFIGYSWYTDAYFIPQLLADNEVIPITEQSFTPTAPIYSPIPENISSLTIN